MTISLESICAGLCAIVRHVARVLPAGTLLGAVVAMRLPRHNHVDGIICLLLAVSGAISGLVYRSTFQEARLDRIAAVVAAFCISPRIISLGRARSRVDEAISCLRDFSIFMAVVMFVVAMCLHSTRERSDRILDAKTELLGQGSKGKSASPRQGTSRTWPLSARTKSLSALSDIGSLPYKHLGPTMRPFGYPGSEKSELTLSSGFKHDPALIMKVIPWISIVNQKRSREGDDESESALHRSQAEWQDSNSCADLN
ncbi:hypothetical protein FZEAL_4483 [Fusarium zealandicum]|uniref:Uncharacterized protein n=1 Tax=Fusarium zealandicum TaxID=1053134 RepID=A0A8H4XKR8_9HYPO|nr:hypothetical protein FZEAL_4483 [Fusarium zealandicum]